MAACRPLSFEPVTIVTTPVVALAGSTSLSVEGAGALPATSAPTMTLACRLSIVLSETFASGDTTRLRPPLSSTHPKPLLSLNSAVGERLCQSEPAGAPAARAISTPPPAVAAAATVAARERWHEPSKVWVILAVWAAREAASAFRVAAAPLCRSCLVSGAVCASRSVLLACSSRTRLLRLSGHTRNLNTMVLGGQARDISMSSTKT